jgi:hypothetical protein
MVLYDNLLYIPKLVSGKPVVERDLDRLQPDLRLAIVAAHVNVHRLIAVKAHEKEPIGTFPESIRHRGRLGDWLRGTNLRLIIRFRI